MTGPTPPLDPRRRPDALLAERQRLWAQAATESGPWHAGSSVMSGVLLFGVLGWLLDRWLGTGWLLPVGVLAGTAVALTSLWFRYGIDRSTRQ